MIIDGHAHVYNEKNAEKIVSAFTELHRMEPTASLGQGTVADLVGKMKENGTDYTVLANFGPSRSVEKINEWTLSVAEEYPQLIPLVSVFPGIAVDKVAGWVQKGAKGIKMHNGIQGFAADDPGLEPVYRFCEENRIPITFHCGETSRVHLNEYTETERLTEVVKQYPGIPFVMTHLAAGDPETVFRVAEECPNVIFDTSITMTGERCIYRIHDDFWESDENVVDAFRRIGCRRISFGSDYPFGNPSGDIRRIRRLGLSDSEKELILGGNSYRLYMAQP
ncbi:MAG: amidohydrolase family protein [Lachnospiraceae bacterium]|nr:amidohydrolase family protein [Lachnospiraceae bacterium]